MSEKTRAELKEQIKIMNHNYQVIREMHEKGYQYSVSEIKRLQDDLERTRKALEIAVKALNKIANTDIKVIEKEPLYYARAMFSVTNNALGRIQDIEQKDVK